MDPAHLATTLSKRTSNCSLVFNGRDVRTTPLLKSSTALLTKRNYILIRDIRY